MLVLWSGRMTPMEATCGCRPNLTVGIKGILENTHNLALPLTLLVAAKLFVCKLPSLFSSNLTLPLFSL